MYQFMHDHSESFPVVKMADLFNIHRSRYYHWKKTFKERAQLRSEEEKLVCRIKKIQKDNRYSYGTPRITDALKKKKVVVNHKKVARILRENSLNHRKKKRFRITTDSNHKLPVAPNLLNRDFTALLPNQKWVSDISYVWSAQGWLYLCVIIDLYSRKVVGWSTSSSINTDLLLRAFWQAVQRRKPGKGLLFHSDRGSQYCSHRFRNVLGFTGMIQSMSRKGNCWDNACAESFFKSLKTEWLYDQSFKTRKEAKDMLFEYIEVFYNRKRTHSSNGYESPESYESKCAA